MSTHILVPELPASTTITYLGSGVMAAARSASANAAASRQRRSSGDDDDDDRGGGRTGRGGVVGGGIESVSPLSSVVIFDRSSRFWLCSSSLSSSLRRCCGEEDGLERELSRPWGGLEPSRVESEREKVERTIVVKESRCCELKKKARSSKSLFTLTLLIMARGGTGTRARPSGRFAPAAERERREVL